jgi:hypothetical protein
LIWLSYFFGTHHDMKQDARLDALEATSTDIQHPQSRHYRYDTLDVKYNNNRPCTLTINGSWHVRQ